LARRHPVHKVFIDAIVAGKSQTEAYLTAYPKVTRVSAQSASARLAKTLRAEIDKRRAKVSERVDMDREKWLLRMAAIFGEDGPDRVAAGDKLAKAERYYPADKVELTGKDGGPLVIDFSVDLSRKTE
jgi:hypothetical protein